VGGASSSTGRGGRGVRVGLVGVGNNSSALVQGVYHYRSTAGAAAVASGRHGLRFPVLCGRAVGDVEFSCAFDVDERKIDLDLGEAILSEPNRYPAVNGPIETGVLVSRAPVLDGVPEFLDDLVLVGAGHRGRDRNGEDFERCVDVVAGSETEVLVNFLPSGSNDATDFFGRVAAAAGAAYVNCTPTPAAHSEEVADLFLDAGVPLLGDDLESHFGSSLVHRTLLEALEQRGLEINHSYQVNLGGNTDFKNLFHRPGAKRASKRTALSTTDSADRVEVVPSAGYLSGLGDNKVGYISVEGLGWLGMPVSIDVKLRVQDSSNAAGVVIDLVRLAGAARDRGLAGCVPFSYYFKNPVGEKLSTPEALAQIEQFDRGDEL
jgi:myo-inositol-1-phosphate synthase